MGAVPALESSLIAYGGIRQTHDNSSILRYTMRGHDPHYQSSVSLLGCLQCQSP
jgi:hypothetical protein